MIDYTSYCESCRINRNIVECKFSYSLDDTGANKGINRNIVECKLITSGSLYDSDT